MEPGNAGRCIVLGQTGQEEGNSFAWQIHGWLWFSETRFPNSLNSELCYAGVTFQSSLNIRISIIKTWKNSQNYALWQTQYLPFFWLAVLFFRLYLCPPNPHYSLVPRCTKTLTNKGTIFHLLSPNSSTTPSLYSISICLSPIPLEWLSQTGCQLWKGFVGAELHSGSNQLPVRPSAGQPAPPCFQAGFIYQTTILQCIYHFHTAMHSVIYEC